MEILVILGMLAVSFWLLGGRKRNATRPKRGGQNAELPVIDMGAFQTAPRDEGRLQLTEDDDIEPPAWVDAVVADFTPDESWGGFTVGTITLESGEEVLGPIPKRLDGLLVAGFEVQALTDGHVATTLRCPQIESRAVATLEEVIAALGKDSPVAASTFAKDCAEVQFDYQGHDVHLTDDGSGCLCLSVDIATPLSDDVVYTIDAEDPYVDDPVMLGERMWIEREEREAAAPLIDALSGETLARLEELLRTSTAFVCGDMESIDFDWTLPFLHGEIATALVREALDVALAIESDGRAQASNDGTW